MDIVLKALSQYNEGQLQQMFVMHFDPLKKKLVLTENQFNLIRKIYLGAFQGNYWCLSDD
jgi:hypothetical protein